VSELKCCKLCGAFLTCDNKGECCPECQYFDEADNLCLAPEKLKRTKKAKPVKKPEEVDPETFLFDDDDDEEDEDEGEDADIEEEEEDFDDDDEDFDDDDDFDMDWD
jgi:hypothetical protein